MPSSRSEQGGIWVCGNSGLFQPASAAPLGGDAATVRAPWLLLRGEPARLVSSSRKIRHLYWLVSGQETRQRLGTSCVPRRGGKAEGFQTPSEDDPTSTSCSHIPLHSTRATGSPGSCRCSELSGSVFAWLGLLSASPPPSSPPLRPPTQAAPELSGLPRPWPSAASCGGSARHSTVPGGGTHVCVPVPPQGRDWCCQTGVLA